MLIAVDFDGTCVTHAFPKIGWEIGAAPILMELVNNGHQLILFTMRSDLTSDPIVTEQDKDHLKSDVIASDYLTQAVKWFEHHGIPLYGIQSNPTQKNWTSSPKAYAQLYIDDAALGCPLTFDPKISDRPFVDWVKVREWLVKEGIL